jgi:hypothetical protein
VVKALANSLKFRTVCCTSASSPSRGGERDAERRKLRLGTDVLVSTPGRLLALLKSKELDLSQLAVMVLDEADVLLMDETFPLQPIGLACGAPAPAPAAPLALTSEPLPPGLPASASASLPHRSKSVANGAGNVSNSTRSSGTGTGAEARSESAPTVSAASKREQMTQFIFVTATLPEIVVRQIHAEFPDALSLCGPGLHRVAPNLQEALVDCSGPSAQQRTSVQVQANKHHALLLALGAVPRFSPVASVGSNDGGDDAVRTRGGSSRDKAAVRRDRLCEQQQQQQQQHQHQHKIERSIVFCNTIEQCRRVENYLLRADARSGSRNAAAPATAAPAQPVGAAGVGAAGVGAAGVGVGYSSSSSSGRRDRQNRRAEWGFPSSPSAKSTLEQRLPSTEERVLSDHQGDSDEYAIAKSGYDYDDDDDDFRAQDKEENEDDNDDDEEKKDSRASIRSVKLARGVPPPQSQAQAPSLALSVPLDVFAHHGAVDAATRQANLLAFSKPLLRKSAVLICTDRGSRGLDFDRAPVRYNMI